MIDVIGHARRIVIDRPGGYDRLRVEAFVPPAPRSGEVRVAVSAAGVNYADCVVRMGLYASAKEFVGWPITPGFEFAGVVDAVGAGVSTFSLGDAVLGVTRFGAYASHIVVPEALLLPRPRDLSAAAAASLPAVGLTAWYARFELARPARGSRVLVHSAAGGVGGMLVQLAREAGDEVIAVVGAAHKVEVARAAGASQVIDKSREDLWAAARRYAPDGYQAIFDANGVSTLRRSYESLAPEGKLVVYGFHSMLPRAGGVPRRLGLAWDWLRTPRFSPFDMTQRNRSVLGFNLSYLFHRHELLMPALRELLQWIIKGRLRIPPIATYELDDVAAAHRALESGRTVGKLLLIP